ncbi:prephenate/arogenate dehydrogenase family protein [Candidatus Viadribacter manganicus]|uniref:prephenate dehydrogenase n=1 Tax=Candidatus Viadribacter manganicus TaxID=1759059 RepID=A0A1B1AFP8_9PROT|nr:prephenate/arogenate dehydrogenase family protein [Candidatus Viadribacter manganicus]ANP45374.1 cyclohexadienyl dehydrogenase [Candidatus Viadribacter manganicus]
MAMIFDRIAIIGAGLIGASIVRAAQASGAANTIHVYDADPAVRARAREIGLGEVFDDPEKAVAMAELVVLATPVGAMGAAAAACARGLKIGAIVTDVGSVKQAVVTAVAANLPTYVYFVPGHPLAGTEHSGPDAGFATLFHNRWQILTPLPDQGPAYPAAIDQLEAFWRALGANVERMDPARHDVVLAVTSHLPHLIAFNIVAMAEDLESVTESEVVKYSASGFRDFTRIAASDPTMWRDVFLNNRDAVLEVLGRFSEDLAALQRAIRWGEGETLYDLFDRARRMRREVIDAGQDTAAPNWGRDETPS